MIRIARVIYWFLALVWRPFTVDHEGRVYRIGIRCAAELAWQFRHIRVFLLPLILIVAVCDGHRRLTDVQVRTVRTWAYSGPRKAVIH